MACGSPVIASINRGTVDIVENEELGVLVNYNSINDFAKGIEICLNNGKKSECLRENAKNAVCRFEKNNILEKMKDIYEL